MTYQNEAEPTRPGGNEKVAANIVCVLGMHRSGTSVATRVLNILGGSLGPDAELVPAAADNPKGFWEHKPIVRLNDSILARLGGRSFAPPALLPGWETSHDLEDLLERGRTLVRGSFVSSELRVWKDPRACLTLAFWQRLMPPMRYVICVRPPGDVARSLHRRNGVGYERSCYLWLRYMLGAFSGTPPHLRCVVAYDRVVDDPMREVARLAAFLETPARARQPDVRAAVDAFLDTSLRHHRRLARQDSPKDDDDAMSSPAFILADRAYEVLAKNELPGQVDIEGALRMALDAVRPGAIPLASQRRPAPIP